MRRNTLRRAAARVIMPAIVGLTFVPSAQGVTKTWVGGNSTWSGSANWSLPGQPLPGDSAVLSQGTFTCTLDSTATLNDIGAVNISNAMTLLQTNGVFSALGEMRVGDTSAGSYTINGGSYGALSALKIGIGGAGIMYISAGTFVSAFSTNIAGAVAGSLTLNGGFIETGTLNINSGGTLNLNTGVLNVGTGAVGGNGQLILNSGAQFNVNGGTFSSATLQLSGGSINVGNSGGFNFGRLNLSSGTLATVPGSFFGVGSANTVVMTGGNITGTALALGQNVGGGTLDQSSGSVNTSFVSVGFAAGGAGTWLLSGTGTASLNTLTIGDSGAGTLIQSAGTISAIAVTMSNQTGVASQYTISGGALTASGSLATSFLVGSAPGSATVTQTGGSVSVPNGGILIGTASAGGTCNYSLGGTGTLNAATLQVGGNLGSGTFTMSGGTATFTKISLSPANGLGTLSMSGGRINTGSIDIQPGGVLDAPGGTISTTGGINLNGGEIKNLNNVTTLTINSGSITSSLVNSGAVLLTATPTTINNFFNASFGTLDVFAGQTLTLTGQTTLDSPMTVVGGTLNQTSGTFTTELGVMNLLGGTLSVGTATLGNFSFSATLNLSGGVATISSLNVGSGSTGSLLVGGANVNITTLFNSATSGVQNVVLSSGTINASAINLGGIHTGTATQTGGIDNVSTLTLNGLATYNLNSGILNPGTIVFNGGTLNLNGGTVTLSTITLPSGTLGGNGSTAFFGTLNQTGGTLAGTFNNSGTYNYFSGAVTGNIINNGVFNVSGPFTVGNGITNFSTINVTLGQLLTVNGSPLDNFATLTLNGGTISGSPVTNEPGASMTARGQINPPISNFGTLTPSGLLNVNDVTNNGIVNLTPGNLFKCLTILNGPNGVIQGSGNLQGTLTNSGEVRANADTTIFLANSLSNAGRITVRGGTGIVNGGPVTNMGLIRGAGAVDNAISNNGIIRAEGGELDLNGSDTNGSTGQIQADTGNTVFFSQGLSGNSGLIALSGGAFDNNSQPLVNGGSIAGNGTIRSAAISNLGTINFGAGNSAVIAPLINTATSKLVITGTGVGSFYRDVTNNSGASFKVDVNSTAIFLGNLTGLSAITGSGTKYFAGTASGGAIVDTGTSVVESGASLSADFIRENALTVEGIATVLPNGLPTHVSRLTQLSFGSAGKFDLSDNDLIVDASPLATIAANIAAGFNGGSWTGNGLTSSSAAATAASAHRTALGYATASSINASVFDGQSVSDGNVLVRYTWSGDANLDGVVNALDFNALASNFGGAAGRVWYQGDFNYDSITNTLDFNAQAQNFNQPAFATLALGTVVPEPITLSAIIALLPLWRTSTRRRGRGNSDERRRGS